MPSTFQFHKPVEDMEKAVLLPEDWTDVEIKYDPESIMNKKLREALDDPENASEAEIAEALESVEGAGYNLHMWLVTEHPEDRFCGHDLQIWLPFPTEKDEFEYRKGQKVADTKMERITDFVIAFGGSVDGSKFSLAAGMKGRVLVIQKDAYDGDGRENGIDIFSGFREYGE